MADASYDVVIIGGGHNALITGCYLALNGLSAAVFERQHELGGGACSDELPLPGFLSNPCAHSTRFYGHPYYHDFKLAEKGLDLVFPEAGCGCTFPDGTCITTYPTFPCVDKMTGRTEFSEENAEKTFRSIAKFSERDAETCRFILERWRTKWGPALSEASYNPPKPWGEKDAIERLMDDPDSGFEPVHGVMTTEQLARDWFESAEMQCFFIRRQQTQLGIFGEDVPGPFFALRGLGVAFTMFALSIPIGGTHSITHAFQRAFSEMGGKFFVHHEVDKVLIENGTAKGIRLVDGTEIEARKMVISGVDPSETILRLIGRDNVSPKVARRSANIKYDRGQVHWANVAFHELPKYKADDYDPDFHLCPSKTLVVKDPDYLASKWKAEVWVYGYGKNLCMNVWEDTRWVPYKAAPGKHNAMMEDYSCPARFLTEKQWLEAKTKWAEEMIRQWQWYAPNMTKDNIIAIFDNTPPDTEKRNMVPEGHWAVGDQIMSQSGRFRPIPELSGYRMPVQNMYYSSAGAHDGGGVRGCPGYNCYKVIAEDFGLRKVWQEKGRSY
jgi:phytoene dehydrogenase-like protein